ncbi:MAG: hypothetical protein AB1726_08995, partial [Planctomycetota bacterium]
AFLEDDLLDDLSNSVLDLIEQGELDEAERRCEELRQRFPQVHDWMERRAAVHQARGQWTQAAALYRQAADFVEASEDGDPELVADLRQQAKLVERQSSIENSSQTASERAQRHVTTAK